jgi:hypothetical protein
MRLDETISCRAKVFRENNSVSENRSHSKYCSFEIVTATLGSNEFCITSEKSEDRLFLKLDIRNL